MSYPISCHVNLTGARNSQNWWRKIFSKILIIGVKFFNRGSVKLTNAELVQMSRSLGNMLETCISHGASLLEDLRISVLTFEMVSVLLTMYFQGEITNLSTTPSPVAKTEATEKTAGGCISKERLKPRKNLR